MIPRAFLGLRGRLLLALVATSVLTLAAAAVALVGPLTERLREESIQNLSQTTRDARQEFERARRKPPEDRFVALRTAGLRLQSRATARVVVGDLILTDFEYDTDIGAPTRPLQLAALESLRTEREVINVGGDSATVAVRLFRPPGVLVAQRQLTDVATTVEQVRLALLAAGGIGLLVAAGLSLAVSSTLLRRLGRLRAAALRVTAEGPEAPPPSDEVRDEVGDLARAFARMQEALKREEASRRSFVATASHELRTPLTMLQGTMELLEEDLADDPVDVADAQRQVARARRELRRLSHLAGELLDLSRLDAQVPLRSEPVELGEMARAVAAEFGLRSRERAVGIVVVPPERPCWALADPDAVARIVRILLDNALRHAPRDTGVRVVAGAGGHPAIGVADRGPGVLPQDRDRIFDRFYRSESNTEGGFGLGLAIGRGLADRMGGTLRLSSGDGIGARFVLELPPARDSTPAPDRSGQRVSRSPA